MADTSRGDLDLVAARSALSALHGPALRTLRRRPKAVSGYIELMADLQAVDLTSQAGSGVRRRFNGFYGVRRPTAWQVVFYSEFEASKERSSPAEALFSGVLEALSSQGRTEASFASKLVASVRPERVIIDRIVAAFVRRCCGLRRDGRSIEAAAAFYSELQFAMERLVESPEAEAWRRKFDEEFAGVPGAADISAMKKLDFLIWAGEGQDAA